MPSPVRLRQGMARCQRGTAHAGASLGACLPTSACNRHCWSASPRWRQQWHRCMHWWYGSGSHAHAGGPRSGHRAFAAAMCWLQRRAGRWLGRCQCPGGPAGRRGPGSQPLQRTASGARLHGGHALDARTAPLTQVIARVLGGCTHAGGCKPEQLAIHVGSRLTACWAAGHAGGGAMSRGGGWLAGRASG